MRTELLRILRAKAAANIKKIWYCNSHGCIREEYKNGSIETMVFNRSRIEQAYITATRYYILECIKHLRNGHDLESL